MGQGSFLCLLGAWTSAKLFHLKSMFMFNSLVQKQGQSFQVVILKYYFYSILNFVLKYDLNTIIDVLFEWNARILTKGDQH